ncbi:MAG TPA: hypothetical protein DCQ04_13270 [Actinobacteria bacterium]|nr:hypothetical protein [Actinomycetota bacterium]
MSSERPTNKQGPSFQFYAADFIIGTAHLTPSDVGVYIRLLALSWDKGPLPDDTRTLAAMAGLSHRLFLKTWRKLEEKWEKTDHFWLHPRLEAQRAHYQAIAEQNAEKGRKGALARQKASAAVQPQFSRSSTGVQPQGQPKGNTPNSDLRSPDLSDEDQASFPNQAENQKQNDTRDSIPPVFGHGRKGAKGGMVTNHPSCDPATHAACPRGFCVPVFHSRAWRQQLDPDGSLPDVTDSTIRAIVASGLAKLPASGAIGVKREQFWGDHWAETHGGTTATGKGFKQRTGATVPGYEATKALLESL